NKTVGSDVSKPRVQLTEPTGDQDAESWMSEQALLHKSVNRHCVAEIIHDQQVGFSAAAFQFGQRVYAIVKSPNNVTVCFQEDRIQVEQSRLVVDRINQAAILIVPVNCGSRILFEAITRRELRALQSFVFSVQIEFETESLRLLHG